MRLPKPENWTPATTERVIKRCWKLFEIYERYSSLDEKGNETSERAKAAELEGMRLQDMINFGDWPANQRPF